MVLSKINKKISYTELKTIDENDKGRDVSMYKIFLFKIPVIIALGDIKYTYVKQGVLFSPVYLVVDDQNKIYQIGVYEFNSDDIENLRDDDGDLDIAKIDGPLLYSFVNMPYVKKCMKNEILIEDDDSGDEEEEEDDEQDDDEEKDEKLEDLDEKKGESKKDAEDGDEEDDKKKEGDKSVLTTPQPTVLVDLEIEDDDDDFLKQGETERDDKKERKKYKRSTSTESRWLEQYMNNNNYGILDNAGGGDCLFYTIKDGYASIGKDASVEKLRTMLSEQVDESILTNYKERYDMLNSELTQLKNKIPELKREKKELRTKYNDLAKEVKKEIDTEKKLQKTKKAKKFKQSYTDKNTSLQLSMKELANVKNNLNEWKWMKGINSVKKLQKKMKTCKFWADIWAISTLEMILKLKLIILSSENYKKGNLNSVMRCGDFVDEKIIKKGYFKPKYFIIVEHTGNHYKLVTYKDKRIFRFHEIPYGIKKNIVDICMKSKGKTLYNYIPKFAKLIGETVNVDEPESVEEDNENKIEKKNEESKEIEEEVEMQPTPTPEDGALFTEDVHFMFYSKSADKKPGMGSGEKISDENKLEYNELAKVSHWRRVLSNFYMKPKQEDKVVPLFVLDGLRWASVEHFYHANKFKKNNPDYYKLFAIDSGSEIMDDSKKALGAGGKTGKIKGKKYRPKDVVIDPDFFVGDNNEKIMERGQQAKYEQCEECRRVLLLTKNAKLIHYISSRKPKDQRPPNVVFYDTMRIRHRLNKSN